jgi:acetylornithine deacetylase/succinyl-diaminopimelate desuccinylase-like protein
VTQASRSSHPAALVGIACALLAAYPRLVREAGAQSKTRRAADLRSAVRAHRIAHEAAILREFRDLLAIPNLANDTPNIQRNAQHIAALLQRRGLVTRLLDGEGGPPVVYGELLANRAARTVILYAHYDGQPVDPSQWQGAPWTPILRDKPLDQGGRAVPWGDLPAKIDPEWRLYARSASDDKAPVIALAWALDALRAGGQAPSVNLKVFFEGEEEAGSPHLRRVLEKNRELLKADLWLFCDGPVHQTRAQQLYFGARGVTGLEITVFGPRRTLHSGHYGNWAPNPAALAAQIVAGLRDRDGRVLAAGFYDDVRPLSAADERALAEVPEVDAQLRQELLLGATEAGGAKLAERILIPALNVRGISSGHVGAAATNAIPTEARISIDFRLVPDQTPESVRRRVEAHLRQQGFLLTHERPSEELRRQHPVVVQLEWDDGGYPAARTGLDLVESRTLVGVIEEFLGSKVIKMPMLGGSIPMHVFFEVTRTPIIGLPVANHDNNQHAANENIRVQNVWDAIELYAGILAGLGTSWPSANP